MVRRIAFLLAAGLFVIMPSGTAHADSGLFLPYVVYPTGSWPRAAVIGDVNSDGMNDVVVTTSPYSDPENNHHIHVFLQDGSGGLQSPVRYPAGNGNSVDIGDLNNDGRNDVVTTVDDGIGVFLQNDDGGLDPMLAYSGTAGGYQLRVGDFNSDGLLDVVSTDWSGHNVDVFLQNTGGTLDAPATYPVPDGWSGDLEVGDVDDNGRDDVIVSNSLGRYHDLAVLLQSPDGGFLSPVYYYLPPVLAVAGVAVGDLNGDGLRDIAATYGGSRPRSHVATFLQNREGTLDPLVSYPSYEIPGPVEVGDVNLDGKDDVILVHVGWRRLGVYLQSNDGTLGVEELYTIPYTTHYNTDCLAIGDINGDGADDAAIADYDHGLVVLYHSPPDCPTCPAPGSTPTPDPTNAIEVVPGDSGVVAISDTFTVEIRVTEAPWAYIAVDSQLEWDAAALEHVSSAAGLAPDGILTVPSSPVVYSGEPPGTEQIYAMGGITSLTPASVTGLVWTVTLRCDEEGVYPLHLVSFSEDFSFGTATSASAGMPHPMALKDGQVECGEPTLPACRPPFTRIVAGDSDCDGAPDAAEVGSDPLACGARDPSDPWDFYDVPVPTIAEGGTMNDRDGTITVTDDVLAVLEYLGTSENGPPNNLPRDYDDDIDGDTVKDGAAYDRSVVGIWSGPPDGAITVLEDLLLLQAQAGTSCPQ